MKSNINTLEHEFSSEELKLIKDYLKYVKEELKHPTKPEVIVGAARYPLGRFKVKSGLLPYFRKKIELKLQEKPERQDKLEPIDKALSNIQTIVENLKVKGKTVKATKRKIYEK